MEMGFVLIFILTIILVVSYLIAKSNSNTNKSNGLDISSSYIYKLVLMPDEGTLVWLYKGKTPCFVVDKEIIYHRNGIDYTKRVWFKEWTNKQDAIDYLLQNMPGVTENDIDPKIYHLTSKEVVKLVKF